MSLAANVPLTTATTTLFVTRPPIRSLKVTSATTSAGNATVTHPTGTVTVAPGASSTVTYTPGVTSTDAPFTLTATAASTATISVQSIPL